MPSLIQALAVLLDIYLIKRLPPGMVQNYLIFALARSLIRAYAQWGCSVETWILVYWWGELLGYLMVIILIANLTHELLTYHLNTTWFYTLAILGIVVMAICHMPTNPLKFSSLLAVGNMARMGAGFLLLLAVVLGKRWGPKRRWIGAGIVINLGCQWMGNWFDQRLGPTVMVSMVHQLGFILLQLSWWIGLNQQPKPTDRYVAAATAGKL